MSQSSSRFIEDEQQDQQNLATTGLLIARISVSYHNIREQAKKLQDMITLQQQRLSYQQLHLLALQERLKQQARKVFQS